MKLLNQIKQQSNTHTHTNKPSVQADQINANINNLNPKQNLRQNPNPNPNHHFRSNSNPNPNSNPKEYFTPNDSEPEFELSEQLSDSVNIQHPSRSTVPPNTNTNANAINPNGRFRYGPPSTNPQNPSNTMSNQPVPESPTTNYVIEYAVVPLILMIIFIALIHPYSSAILEKYMPPLTSMKGYATRALILGFAYIILRGIVSFVKKN